MVYLKAGFEVFCIISNVNVILIYLRIWTKIAQKLTVWLIVGHDKIFLLFV